MIEILLAASIPLVPAGATTIASRNAIEYCLSSSITSVKFDDGDHERLTGKSRGFLDLIDKLDKIGGLEADWAAKGSCEFDRKVIENTLVILNAFDSNYSRPLYPDLIPTPGGTIVLEWEALHAAAVIEIGSNQFSGYIERESGETEYISGAPIEFDASLLSDFESINSSPSTSSLVTYHFSNSHGGLEVDHVFAAA